MASYTQINEDTIVRDVPLALHPSLYAAALPDDEAQLGFHFKQTEPRDWYLAPSEQPDWSCNHRTLVEGAEAAASTPSYITAGGTLQSCASYVGSKSIHR